MILKQLSHLVKQSYSRTFCTSGDVTMKSLMSLALSELPSLMLSYGRCFFFLLYHWSDHSFMRSSFIQAHLLLQRGVQQVGFLLLFISSPLTLGLFREPVATVDSQTLRQSRPYAILRRIKQLRPFFYVRKHWALGESLGQGVGGSRVVIGSSWVKTAPSPFSLWEFHLFLLLRLYTDAPVKWFVLIPLMITYFDKITLVVSLTWYQWWLYEVWWYESADNEGGMTSL